MASPETWDLTGILADVKITLEAERVDNLKDIAELDWTRAVYVSKDADRLDGTVDRVYHLREVDPASVRLGQAFYLHDGRTWKVSLISDMGGGITCIQLTRRK